MIKLILICIVFISHCSLIAQEADNLKNEKVFASGRVGITNGKDCIYIVLTKETRKLIRRNWEHPLKIVEDHSYYFYKLDQSGITKFFTSKSPPIVKKYNYYYKNMEIKYFNNTFYLLHSQFTIYKTKVTSKAEGFYKLSEMDDHIQKWAQENYFEPFKPYDLSIKNTDGDIIAKITDTPGNARCKLNFELTDKTRIHKEDVYGRVLKSMSKGDVRWLLLCDNNNLLLFKYVKSEWIKSVIKFDSFPRFNSRISITLHNGKIFFCLYYNQKFHIYSESDNKLKNLLKADVELEPFKLKITFLDKKYIKELFSKPVPPENSSQEKSDSEVKQ